MMKTREEYLELISARGDRYGGSGGLYDLLEWSGRIRLPDVTLAEARAFYENPAAPPPRREEARA